MVSHFKKNDDPRALITGIRGFGGRYLAEELRKAGYRVYGVALEAEGADKDVYPADLCNQEELCRVVAEVRPDVVAHLAGVSFVPYDDVDAIYRVNIIGTRNLLFALKRCPKMPRAVLLASSALVYGNSHVELLDETVALNPASDYAISKLAMEYMSDLWTGSFPIVIVRSFNYTGVGQADNFVLPKIVSHFTQKKREIELGNIDVARDFSDVRDVMSFYHQLLKLAPAREIFNVCSGLAYSVRDVLGMMAEIAGYEIAVRVNPNFVRKNEVSKIVGSDAKLRRVVGDSKRIPLVETLRWMYNTSLSP